MSLITDIRPLYKKLVIMYYNMGKYTNDEIAGMVKKGLLTSDDFKDITGIAYTNDTGKSSSSNDTTIKVDTSKQDDNDTKVTDNNKSSTTSNKN
jgi:hypothetical protein